MTLEDLAKLIGATPRPFEIRLHRSDYDQVMRAAIREGWTNLVGRDLFKFMAVRVVRLDCEAARQDPVILPWSIFDFQRRELIRLGYLRPGPQDPTDRFEQGGILYVREQRIPVKPGEQLGEKPRRRRKSAR